MASTPSSSVDPMAAAMDSLSKRLDRMMQRMEEVLARSSALEPVVAHATLARVSTTTSSPPSPLTAMAIGATTGNVKPIVAAFEFAKVRRETERRRQRMELFTSMVPATSTATSLASLSSSASSTTPTALTSATPTSVDISTLNSATTSEPHQAPPARCSTWGQTHGDGSSHVPVSAASAPSPTSSRDSPAPSAAPTHTGTVVAVLCTDEEVPDESTIKCLTVCLSQNVELLSHVRYISKSTIALSGDVVLFEMTVASHGDQTSQKPELSELLPISVDKGKGFSILLFDQLSIPPKPPWSLLSLEDDTFHSDSTSQNVWILCSWCLKGSITLFTDDVQLRSIPWPSFSCNTVVVCHFVNQYIVNFLFGAISGEYLQCVFELHATVKQVVSRKDIAIALSWSPVHTLSITSKRLPLYALLATSWLQYKNWWHANYSGDFYYLSAVIVHHIMHRTSLLTMLSSYRGKIQWKPPWLSLMCTSKLDRPHHICMTSVLFHITPSVLPMCDTNLVAGSENFSPSELTILGMASLQSWKTEDGSVGVLVMLLEFLHQWMHKRANIELLDGQSVCYFKHKDPICDCCHWEMYLLSDIARNGQFSPKHIVVLQIRTRTTMLILKQNGSAGLGVFFICQWVHAAVSDQMGGTDIILFYLSEHLTIDERDQWLPCSDSGYEKACTYRLMRILVYRTPGPSTATCKPGHAAGVHQRAESASPDGARDAAARSSVTTPRRARAPGEHGEESRHSRTRRAHVAPGRC